MSTNSNPHNMCYGFLFENVYRNYFVIGAHESGYSLFCFVIPRNFVINLPIGNRQVNIANKGI